MATSNEQRDLVLRAIMYELRPALEAAGLEMLMRSSDLEYMVQKRGD